MWKKVALNVFYNLGVIVSGFGIYWGYTNRQYLYVALFAVTIALFLYLKINLSKEFRRESKEFRRENKK